MRCAAYCSTPSFDITGLFNHLKNHYTPLRFRDVIHIRSEQLEEDAKEGDVFFFPYGAVVCWGLRDDQERRMLNEIRPFEQQTQESLEDDIFSYSYGAEAKIEDDEMTLPASDILTKLALSHGIAQSVKLGSLEQRIQKTIHLTQKFPEFLATQGKIPLSRKQIRRMMGRLFLDRSALNFLELLDTPEFFWEHTDLESLYHLVAVYLDKDRRVNVLNQRLVIVQELLDMLGSELNHQHSAQLEWTIILLIVLEVVLSISSKFGI